MISLVELAAFLGRWLFIVTAPVLLIVVVFYYHAGLSFVEPLVGLAVVAAVFAVTCLFSAKLHSTRLVGREKDRALREVMIGSVLNSTETWNLHVEGDGRKQAVAKEEARRANQRKAELWKQAHPWGGYNPYE